MRDGIGDRRIRTFPFLPTQSLTFRLGSSENQIVGVGSRSGRINQSQSTFLRFVVVLDLLLLLPSDNLVFTMDHKRNVSNGVVSGIRTLFSLDHKRKATPCMGRLNLILILSNQKVLDTGPGPVSFYLLFYFHERLL